MPSWPLRTGCDKAESRVAPSTCAVLSDYTTSFFQQFQHCSTWVFGSKCCEISPVATLSPLLRNPTLLQTHSCPIQAFIRIPIAATRTGGSIETWAAASWGCEGNVHTRQGLPRGCVAAAGRATSVGLRNCSAASRKNARVDTPATLLFGPHKCSKVS